MPNVGAEDRKRSVDLDPTGAYADLVTHSGPKVAQGRPDGRDIVGRTTMKSPAPYAPLFERLSRIGAAVVAAVGAAVLVGWRFDIVLLKSVVPGLASMKANAAVGFLFSGLAVLLLHSPPPAARRLRLSRVLAVLIVALGALTLAEYIVSVDFGIDQWLFSEGADAVQTSHPGRMSPATAFSFLFVGAALLGIRRHGPFLISRAHWPALPPLFVSTLAIVGYAYGVGALYRMGPYTSMAAHAAFAFFVLSLSILAADPTRGIARIAASDTTGGVVARRLLLSVPVALFALGWVRLLGEQAGLYDGHFGLALMVLFAITVSVFAVASTATKLHAVDRSRQLAEDEIIALNEGLERRVKERTRELEDALASVNQLTGLLPICAWCKRIRDDQDYWRSVEEYVTARTGVQFTHGMCPSCRETVRTDAGA